MKSFVLLTCILIVTHAASIHKEAAMNDVDDDERVQFRKLIKDLTRNEALASQDEKEDVHIMQDDGGDLSEEEIKKFAEVMLEEDTDKNDLAKFEKLVKAFLKSEELDGKKTDVPDSTQDGDDPSEEEINEAVSAMDNELALKMQEEEGDDEPAQKMQDEGDDSAQVMQDEEGDESAQEMQVEEGDDSAQVMQDEESEEPVQEMRG